MEPPYTIGRLARLAGVPPSTLRYYERSGLLVPEARSDGNYRLYGPASVQRVRFILAAKANGFTLDAIAVLLALRDGRAEPCRNVQDLLQERLEDVQARLRQLRKLRQVLESSLEQCREAEAGGHCRVMDALGAAVPDSPGKNPPPP